MVTLDFTKLDGLVPAVAQDWKTGEVQRFLVTAEPTDATLARSARMQYDRRKVFFIAVP